MFDVRLREFTPAGVRGKVLPTASLSVSIQESDVAGVKFAVSEHVAGRLQVPFVVGVEYSTGGAYAQPRNGLFIVTDEGGDSADASKTFTFDGQAFVPWLLSGMHQRANTYTGARFLQGKQEWPNVTPGRILRSLIDHGKTVDGWAPMLTTDFTATTDSAGAAWTNAERWSPEFQNLTPVRQIFDAHVTNGLIDWWAEGTKLRVFRPGSGVVHPNLRLGGPGFSRMPVKQAFEEQFNYLTAMGESGNYQYFTNPGAESRFGRTHVVMTLSGVKDADVPRMVQPILAEGRTLRRELSYEWRPVAGLPTPWADFEVGDAVQARGRDGWVEQRVLGVTVTKSGQDMTVRATVGSKLLNRMKRVIGRVNGGSLGDIQGGTGVTIPSGPAPALAAPLAPSGLHVDANTAVWAADGTAVTSVTFGWSAVLAAADGSEVDGVTYEVWARTGASSSARVTSTDALTFTVEGWEPGTARFVKVRALDRAGNFSAFSPEVAVTPVVPASIIPKPVSGLGVVSNTGTFGQDGSAVAAVTVGWDAVVLSTDDTLVDIAEYEVRQGQSTQRVTGLSAVLTVPSGREVEVRVRALSTLGVWGDLSPVLNVTGSVPSGVIPAPTPPVLDSGVSTVTSKWDGLLTTGAPPAGFGFVYMDTAPDDEGVPGVWSPFGTPLTGAGGASIRGVMGDTVWVRLRSTDTLGRPGGTSEARQVVVVGTGGDDIISGSIQVNNVSPSFGDDLNLSANESVTIIVGTQNAQAAEIADLGVGVADAQATAGDAQATAGGAQAAADDAQAAADAAAGVAADAASQVETLGLWVRIDEDDMSLGRPGGVSEVSIAPEGIQFRQNNVVSSEWVGGVMITPEAKLIQASIANHQFLPYGEGRTIIRRL